MQFDGSEIGVGAPGNLNPGAGGTGPIYVLPGCYLFLNSTTIAVPFTNQLYIAGCGDGSEPLGAVRGGIFAGPVTMIGDTDLGGGPTMLSAISGPFNLTLGSEATVNGGAILCNTNDNWTGNTTMVARNNTGNNTVTMSNSFVIPNGPGYGNVALEAFNGLGSVWWNLNGFNETINGLSTINASLALGTTSVTNCVITNSVSATVSTLTLGNNDQSGLWGGNIAGGSSPGNGTINVTKIGAGVETLTNINTYVGTTTISNGVLQLIGGGSIASSPTVTINGGTFDVSSVAYTIPAAQNINVSGGTFFISTGTGSSGGLVNFTNGTLKIPTLSGSGNGSGTPSLTVPTLNIGGASNFILPASMPPVPAYPAVYPVIQYTTLNGSVSTFSPVLPAGGFPA
ncbi:MAG TPA: autotransporter-associated beta strand repeat-containing protein, partial [Phycisphaerae bacterium]|nr:autotransporter-associated beta strand repeat-containing protein [Phycisphaerae bacterium]